MYIASSINPASSLEGNVPVSIFTYNGQRKFLRVSESYEVIPIPAGYSFNFGIENVMTGYH